VPVEASALNGSDNMKIARYSLEGTESYGSLEDGIIRPLEGPLDGLRPRHLAEAVAVSLVRLLAPAKPSKIVAVGVNYREHAREMGRPLPTEPMLFIKPPSAVIGPEEAIIYPAQTKRLDYEGELAVVIAKPARNLSVSQVRHHLFGFTCLNDVTARDLQARDVQFTRAKGFDTFAPVGPVVDTDVDPRDLMIQTRLNGTICQSSRTSELIFDPYQLVSYVSQIMTLLPGDVVSTGTPSGVGPMKVGDTVEVEIEKIGCLRNTVAAPR